MTEFFFSNQNLFAILIIIALTLSFIAFVLAVINMVQINKIKKTTKVLFAGKKGVDLEKIVLDSNKKILELDTEVQELFNISNTINKQSHKSIHKVGLIRFNPFGERAGNQSFALALLNSNDDGITLSSLHTREGTRLYTKQILKGQPVNNELTQEEHEVLKIAK